VETTNFLAGAVGVSKKRLTYKALIGSELP
jgi:hypothetical protein